MEYGQPMKANYQGIWTTHETLFLVWLCLLSSETLYPCEIFYWRGQGQYDICEAWKEKKKKRELDLFRACQWVGVMQTWARIKRRVSLSISLSCHLKEEVAGRRGKWMCPQRSPPLSSLLHSAPELTFASYSYYYYLSFSLHPSLMFFFFLLSSSL